MSVSSTPAAEKAVAGSSSETASVTDLERNDFVPQVQAAFESPEASDNTTDMAFSTWAKIYYTAIPCFLAYLITFSASVVAPATTALMSDFNVSRTVALLSGTVYLVGLALGPMFLAPLSELVGRRWLYVVTSTSIIVFACGAGASHTYAGFLICRFLCGFFGSSGVAIGAGTIFDVWGASSSTARGLASLLFIYGPFMGPSMGPLAGAYIMHEYGGDWRWTQWLIALIGAPIWILILFMKETSTVRVAYDGSRADGRFGVIGLAGATLKAALVRSTTMLTTEAIAFLITLYTGYAYAVVFSFFASGSYVYLVDYGFNERQVGLMFLGVFIGYVLAAVLHVVVEKTLYARAERLAPNGRPAPEHRLYSAMAGSVFLPIGLFLYAWAAHPAGHGHGGWAVVAASGIPFGIGAFVLFLSSIMYLVESYGASASASALAANGSIRYLLGAIFPLFTIQMYETLGVHWAGSLFAFLSLALLPIPWLLFKYGRQLRKNSRFIHGP